MSGGDERFGGRLRRALVEDPSFDCPAMRDIADAIDQDVTEAAGIHAGRSLIHLGEVEEKARYYKRLYLEKMEELRVMRKGTREQLGAADAAIEAAESRHADLRRKIEQLVEELRFAVGPGWRAEKIEMHVEVEPLLERLDSIFSGGSVGAADTQSSA